MDRYYRTSTSCDIRSDDPPITPFNVNAKLTANREYVETTVCEVCNSFNKWGKHVIKVGIHTNILNAEPRNAIRS